MTSIHGIFRYPIKGLSPEALSQVHVDAGETIPGDRQFAFARAAGLFDAAKPAYLSKTNFLMLQRDERLAALATRFDVDRQTLFIEHDVGVFESDLSTEAGRQAAEGFFATYMGDDLRERPRLESAPGHSFSDLDAKVISIINLASVKDLSASVGAVLDPLRFRANIYIEGLPAWQEFEWLDREIGIGNVRLEVIKRTQRCAATNVNPKTAKRDHNLPKALQQAYGHADLGIYARVIEGGGISLGEVIQLLG